MKKNVGGHDKTLRIVVGVISLILGYMVSPWFYVLAVIGFGTAAIGWCPINRLLGINTCGVHVEEKKEDSAPTETKTPTETS